MNIERLATVVNRVLQDASRLDYRSKLETLRSALQSQVNDPANAALLPPVSAAYEDLLGALRSLDAELYPETYTDSLRELRCDLLVPGVMSKSVENIFSRNQITPTKALEDLTAIHSEVKGDLAALQQIAAAFTRFDVEADDLQVGEAELTYIMPRSEVESSLERFARDNLEFDRAIKFFEEVVTGSRSEVPIRKISSSDFMVMLGLSPGVLLVISHAVRDLLKTYEKVLDIKIKTNELKALKVPEETIESLRLHMTDTVNQGIAKIIEERVMPLLNSKAEPRSAELKNEAKIVISRLADRIDRGYQIEVRVGPLPGIPQSAEGEEFSDPQKELRETLDELRRVSSGMTFLRASGEPVLRLTDSSEPGTV